ncbi:cysteine desulfurase family protein [Hydrogenibacillus schlegelii]|uniref:Cysteine desulfurase n=1 Tax=Hydrogenibacillus schlegelii TaxID=1484 RepID=A0A179ISP2_HYDSH|nr:cysteine desulfurase family protein [Hydrogenibacillus schlegelii]OAR04621.1 hypothetical protein SA87_08765 [Hydrogenibacillus schlegelii]PTQ54840.1 MAG: Cysteine desulfurase [Hydrogenibacillus schlegelii]
MAVIYLDNAATTRPDPAVLEAYARAAADVFANPASLHGLGARAEALVEEARAQAARFLGVRPEEIVFTSGGTEANNLALFGAARASAGRGRHILVSPIEHPSVREAAEALGREGFSVERLPVDRYGRVDPDAVARALRPETILVSVMAVNNELGTVQDLAAIGERVKKSRALFHVDAVQAYAVMPVRPAAWQADLVTLSAHKWHGLKGIGLLFVRKGVRLVPLLFGGGQERGLRPGTTNAPLIAATARAMRLAEAAREAAVERFRRQRTRLIEAVEAAEGEVLSPPDGAPHLLAAAFPPVRAETLVHALADAGVFVSTRAACSSRSREPSAVLKAVGLPEAVRRSAIRLSLARDVSDEDVERAAETLVRTVRRLRSVHDGMR